MALTVSLKLVISFHSVLFANVKYKMKYKTNLRSEQ